MSPDKPSPLSQARNLVADAQQTAAEVRHSPEGPGAVSPMEAALRLLAGLRRQSFGTQVGEALQKLQIPRDVEGKEAPLADLVEQLNRALHDGQAREMSPQGTVKLGPEFVLERIGENRRSKSPYTRTPGPAEPKAMAPCIRTVEIEATPETVWAYLADLPQWVVWDPDMKEVADIWGGGMAEGGSFLAKLDAVSTRIYFRDVQENCETKWGGTAAGGSITFDALFKLEPLSGGQTRFTYEFEMKGCLGRVINCLKPQASIDGVEKGAANIKAKAEEIQRTGVHTAAASST
eukprot:s6106_g1.t1